MRSIRVWPKARTMLRGHEGVSASGGRAAGVLFRALIRAARQNWIFAVSEISKGLVVVTIGDLVTADELGELLGVVAQDLASLREGGRLSAFALLQKRKKADRPPPDEDPRKRRRRAVGGGIGAGERQCPATQTMLKTRRAR